MENQPVHFPSLFDHGVTKKMLLDISTIEQDKWFFHVPKEQPGIPQQLQLRIGQHNIVLRWVIRDVEINVALAHEYLVDTILGSAHLHDKQIIAATLGVDNAYLEQGAVKHSTGWCALYAPDRMVSIFTEPEWVGEDDLQDGTPHTVSEVIHAVSKFAPLSTGLWLEHYFKVYDARWPMMHLARDTAKFTVHYEKVAAGSKLHVYLTTKEFRHLRWTFSVVDHINKDSLVPSNWMKSLVEDFV